jgi:aldehyde:ferredoxin oxidoreductase
MDYLYTGNMLVVDLQKGETRESILDDGLIESKLGGAAVNLELFKQYESMDPVVIGSGLFTSTMIPGSAMSVVTARSPTADRIMHSPIVNFMGAELKLAGFDFIVVHGRSPKPVYLWLHDEIADLLPADEIWGQDTWKTVDYVREEQGEGRIQVLSIGPAGEKGGSIAQAVVNYWSEGDKIGLGKRLGDMRLKAICTRGMGELELAHPASFLELCLPAMEDARAKLADSQGIEGLMPDMDLKNFNEVRHRNSACFSCPWPCRTFAKYNEPPTVLKEAHPEPGMLIIDAPGFAALLNEGFDAIEASRLMETSSRIGVEPVGVGPMLKGLTYQEAKSRIEEMGSSQTNVGSIPTIKGACRSDLFSPFAPNGGEEHTLALAYVLGICPRYAVKAGLDRARASQFIKACTDLEVEPATLENIERSILV